MINKIPHSFILQFVVIMGLMLLIASLGMFQTGDQRIQLAEKNYRKGEAAMTIAERKESFNSALDDFLQLEAAYHPQYGNGKLSFDIANTYFQLGEYPLSILYYKRAENLMPRSDLVKRNLRQAQEKLGLPETQNSSVWNALLLKPYLSIPERLQVFFILALFALLFSSVWFWTRKYWVFTISVFFLSLLAVFLINLGISYYFSPVEAVLIKAAELRRDAGMEFAKVGDQPLVGGTVLEVIDTSPNRNWFKVLTPEGEFGYVPAESVKFVDL